MFHRFALVFLMLASGTGWAQEPSFNGRTLTEWQTLLKEDMTPRKRRAAIVALGQIATMSKDSQPQIVLAISKALRADPAVVVREEAAAFLNLQKIDEVMVAALPDLVESIRIEREVTVKKSITTILGRFGKLGRTAVQPLTANLKDADAAIRAATAEALGRIGTDAKSAQAPLLEMLAEKDKAARQGAVFALGRIDPEEQEKVATALLKVLLADPEKSLRQEAVDSLGFLGYASAEVIKGITSRLTEPEAEIRLVASQTLPKFGAKLNLVQEELKVAFRTDKEKQVRLNAVRALTLSAGLNRGPLVALFAEQLSQDQDFEVRIAIAEELGTYGAEAKVALPSLRVAQRDSQIKVREAASRAIKLIEKPVPSPKP